LSNTIIFLKSTLKSIAAAMEVSVVCNIDQSEVTGLVKLTPIQIDFFGRGMANPNYYNQSVLLKCSRELDVITVQNGINKLVAHHDILRSYYSQDKNLEWKQVVRATSEFDYVKVLEYSTNESLDGSTYLDSLQSSLDLSRGILYQVALMNLSGEQYLFITIHHLIIDLVSWRIIYEDLESLFENRPLPMKSLSFKKWSDRFSKDIKENPEWNFHTLPITNCIQK
ncbi:hypothetical protein HDV01_004040, partial [Terramyces sp. JEL0728]